MRPIGHLLDRDLDTVVTSTIVVTQTTMRYAVSMPAQLIVRDRVEFADDAIAHITVWRVPRPLPGSRHGFKYRLAYVVNDECVLRYDNESGKGDHRHQGADETPYRFTSLARVMDDFRRDIERWNHENGIV